MDETAQCALGSVRIYGAQRGKFNKMSRTVSLDEVSNSAETLPCLNQF